MLIHIYTHSHKHYRHTHICTCIYTHIYTHIHTHIHTPRACMCECVCTHACVCSFRTKGRCGMPSSIALSFTLSRKGFLLYLSAPFQVEQPASTQAPPVSARHLWGCRHAMPGFLTWVLGIQTRLLKLATARALAHRAFFGAPDFPLLPKSGMPLLTFSSDHLQSQHPSKPLAPGTSSFGSISMLDKLTV